MADLTTPISVLIRESFRRITEAERNLKAAKSSPKGSKIWRKHYSLSIGAKTDEEALEIAAKCKAARVSCEFDKHLRLKVNSLRHQQDLADAIFGKGKVRNLDRY